MLPTTTVSQAGTIGGGGGATVTVDAVCPAGTTVTGGGYEFSPSLASIPQVVENHANSATSCEVTLRNTSLTSVPFTVYATCVPQTP